MTETVAYRYTGPLQAVTLFALNTEGKRKTDKAGKPEILFDGLLHPGKPVGYPGETVPLDPTHPVVAGLIALKRLTPLGEATDASGSGKTSDDGTPGTQPRKAKRPSAGRAAEAEPQTEPAGASDNEKER